MRQRDPVCASNGPDFLGFTTSLNNLHSFSPFQIKHRFERLEGKAGEVIVKAADQHNADFIVCGSRGLGAIRRTILGTVSGYILHHSHVPVLVCKHEDERHKYDHHSQKHHGQ